MGKEPTSNEKWKDRSDSGEIITEPTIVERLRNLEKQFISTPNRYAAEVCHRASEKLEALSEINEKFVTDWNNLCRTNMELQTKLDEALGVADIALKARHDAEKDFEQKLKNAHAARDAFESYLKIAEDGLRDYKQDYNRALKDLIKTEARLDAAEKRDVVTPEYLQGWIERAQAAENTTRELRIKLQNSHVVSTQTIEDMKE
jgi:hypothetical protein